MAAVIGLAADGRHVRAHGLVPYDMRRAELGGFVARIFLRLGDTLRFQALAEHGTAVDDLEERATCNRRIIGVHDFRAMTTCGTHVSEHRNGHGNYEPWSFHRTLLAGIAFGVCTN